MAGADHILRASQEGYLASLNIQLHEDLTGKIFPRYGLVKFRHSYRYLPMSSSSRIAFINTTCAGIFIWNKKIRATRVVATSNLVYLAVGHLICGERLSNKRREARLRFKCGNEPRLPHELSRN